MTEDIDRARQFDVALGKALAAARRSAGLTQERLAEMADVHWTYVSQLERGLKSPTVRVLKQLASALGQRASGLIQQAEDGTG